MPLPAVTLLKSEIARKGGLEKYTWQIALAFQKLGAEVTLLTTGPKIPSPPGIHLVYLSDKYPLSVWNVYAFDRACAAYLKAHPTPIVFGLDRNRFQTHIRAGNGSHAGYLEHRAATEGWMKGASFRINPLHRLLLNIEKESFEHPDLRVLFTNSHMVRNEILSRYTVASEKVQVVHNGVEWDQMQSDFDRWEIQRPAITRALRLDPDAHHLLFIGHNYQRKGLAELLHGLAHLNNPDVHLNIVGKDKHSACYEHLAVKLGLQKQVRFFGANPQILPFYQLADTLVIPSHYDPFANVTVEALAMGLFVVSSKTNGGHEVLTPEAGTVISNLNAPESIAESLNIALQSRKTPLRAQAIRNSIRHLDFKHVLTRLTAQVFSP
jgi:UDP-glucose:(heptosyl)LPS alpha-1,3-glucosyltransferase